MIFKKYWKMQNFDLVVLFIYTTYCKTIYIVLYIII